MLAGAALASRTVGAVYEREKAVEQAVEQASSQEQPVFMKVACRYFKVRLK
jgi:hypothetical protein